jgi:hypothetical protein
MLNFKSLWKYLENTPKPEQTNTNKGSMILQTPLIWRFYKGFANLNFAYLSILTASMKDGFLGIVAMMACDTPASCVGTILLGGLIDLS